LFFEVGKFREESQDDKDTEPARKEEAVLTPATQQDTEKYKEMKVVKQWGMKSLAYSERYSS